MNLIKHKDRIVLEKKFPGLIDVKFTHEIKSTTAKFDYLGPKIPPEAWQMMLSFFKWTYDTTHSESQVRLYVNTERKVWGVWAYPQEARTGMSAREIDNEQTKVQRAQFPDSEGWIYFGTVHHHCGCSAFQSGVDEANEQNQDGLHITVGSMNSPHYDLHCRFYLNGACFEPDMSLFWDVGDEARKMFPIKFHNDIARHQMGTPNAVDFPDVWRTNLIEVKPSYSVGTTQGSVGFRGELHTRGSGYDTTGAAYGTSAGARAWQAAKTILEDVAESPWTLEQLNLVMEFLKEDAICDIIMNNMSYFRIDFYDLVNAWPEKKPAKKIFNKALKRYRKEVDGTVGVETDVEVDDDEVTTTTGEGEPPAGEAGGTPPTGHEWDGME